MLSKSQVKGQLRSCWSRILSMLIMLGSSMITSLSYKDMYTVMITGVKSQASFSGAFTLTTVSPNIRLGISKGLIAPMVKICFILQILHPTIV